MSVWEKKADLSELCTLFSHSDHCFSQLAVTALMAVIVGAIFYGVKDDQSGVQNR